MIKLQSLLGIAGIWMIPFVGFASATMTFGAQADGADFNGDGFDDLALGIRSEDIDSPDNNCGSVQVFHGSADGITLDGDQIWHQNQPNIQDDCEPGDEFGAALAWGDFDGDGFDDLAIGIPNEQVEGDAEAAGAVAVLYGSPVGLRAAQNQLFSQGSPGVATDPDGDDEFGRALAAGDFDGDGFDDLAIGAPYETVNGIEFAGAVHILFGSPSGLKGQGSQFLHQDVPSVEDQAEENDEFATSLTTGDFNGDGRDDLAVGIPFESIADLAIAGAMHVFYGSGNGLKVSNDQFWHQDVPGIADQAEQSDAFGNCGASGDFNRDGFDDLAIGINREDIDLLSDAGAVHVLFGSAAGLTAAGDQFLHQDTLALRIARAKVTISPLTSPPATSTTTGSMTSRSALILRRSPALMRRAQSRCSMGGVMACAPTTMSSCTRMCPAFPTRSRKATFGATRSRPAITTATASTTSLSVPPAKTCRWCRDKGSPKSSCDSSMSRMSSPTTSMYFSSRRAART